MSKREVVTDDTTGIEITTGTPYWDVTYKIGNNAYATNGQAVDLIAALTYLSTIPNLTSATLKQVTA
jgi:hypothetical protein